MQTRYASRVHGSTINHSDSDSAASLVESVVQLSLSPSSPPPRAPRFPAGNLSACPSRQGFAIGLDLANRERCGGVNEYLRKSHLLRSFCLLVPACRRASAGEALHYL